MTEHCVIDEYGEGYEKALRSAVRAIKEGGVVALATDTLYGIACDATNPSAVQKLYNIKARDPNKPIAVCVDSVRMIKLQLQTSAAQSALIKSLLPGPYTFILKRRQLRRSKRKLTPSGDAACTINPICKLLNANDEYLGVRIPDNQFIIELAKRCSTPLALTSANLSGKMSPLKVTDFKNIWQRIDTIIDSGEIQAQSRAGSTIIKFGPSGHVMDYLIVREGVAGDLFRNAAVSCTASVSLKSSGIPGTPQRLAPNQEDARDPTISG